MTIREYLSDVQKAILKAMAAGAGPDGTVACFSGKGARTQGFMIAPYKDGVGVRCYQAPQTFLRARGLIELCRPVVAGQTTWYRITPAGRAKIAKGRGRPRKDRRSA
jgi:hypothetical protein